MNAIIKSLAPFCAVCRREQCACTDKARDAALVREFHRLEFQRHPEERDPLPRDPDMLAAWDAGVPMQGPP